MIPSNNINYNRGPDNNNNNNFMKKDRGTGMWFDIGDAKAIKKTGQRLREDASGTIQNKHYYLTQST